MKPDKTQKLIITALEEVARLSADAAEVAQKGLAEKDYLSGVKKLIFDLSIALDNANLLRAVLNHQQNNPV